MRSPDLRDDTALVGDVLIIPPAIARELWPAIRSHARELMDAGAHARLGRLRQTLESWEQVAVHDPGRRADAPATSATGVDRSGFSHEPIDVAEAAARLNCGAPWVRKLLDRRDLDGVKVGGSWAIDPASVDRHLELNRNRDHG